MGKLIPKKIQPVVNEQKEREARELTRSHTEWLVHKDWLEIERRISEVGILPGSRDYDEIYSVWEGWREKDWDR